jgi:hypothetical protein
MRLPDDIASGVHSVHGEQGSENEGAGAGVAGSRRASRPRAAGGRVVSLDEGYIALPGAVIRNESQQVAASAAPAPRGIIIAASGARAARTISSQPSNQGSDTATGGAVDEAGGTADDSAAAAGDDGELQAKPAAVIITGRQAVLPRTAALSRSFDWCSILM